MLRATGLLAGLRACARRMPGKLEVTFAGAEANVAVTVASLGGRAAAGLMVSCDLNFRRKLWRWNSPMEPGELAGQTLGQLLPSVDLLLGGPADIAQAVGKEVAGQSVIAMACEYARQFPQTNWIPMTLGEGCSATQNRWGALLHDVRADAVYLAPLRNGDYTPFEIPAIVDRLRTGDVCRCADSCITNARTRRTTAGIAVCYGGLVSRSLDKGRF